MTLKTIWGDINYMRSTFNLSYRHELDLLKGLAIVAVVLYHAGWCKGGYLGVDVFFVVSGYLAVPSVMRQIGEGQFRYLTYLERRVFRLLPLVLLVCGLSLIVGCWGMLPGDLRFLSEEVMAASVFMNNLLQAVTTQNYWAAIYHKVLMHTWYLGVLFQFYLVFPLLLMVFRWRMRAVLVALTVLSLTLYLLPVDSIGNKYYLLPYRFFEMGIGGLIALWPKRQKSEGVGCLSLLCLILMIFFGTFTIGERAMPYNLVSGTNTIRESFLPRELLVLLTAGLTAIFIRYSGGSRIAAFSRQSRVLAPLGRMSLSIFLWHQPLLAFYRYFIADQIVLPVLLLVLLTTLLLSSVTYQLMERRMQITRHSRLCILSSFLAVNAFALWVYGQDGVLRDIPELGIHKGASNFSAGIPLPCRGGTGGEVSIPFEQYTDRIYQYNKDFNLSDSTRLKVLVIGNSFARDFANILLESPDSDRIQLSYRYSFDDCPLSRIRQCDRIYFFGWKHEVPKSVWSNLRSDADIWGIGTKNFGTSNGIFYKHRHCPDYFAQRTAINTDFHTVNRLLSEEWGDRYIDLLSPVLQPDSTVPVFTPDRHFITYDCRHLTPAGTRYYARLLKKFHVGQVSKVY